MSPATIRDANLADRATVEQFHRDLYVDHQHRVTDEAMRAMAEYEAFDQVLRDDVNALLRDPQRHVLLAEEGGRALGYITGHTDSDPRRRMRRRGIVEDWFVADDARGQGIGRLLLQSLLERFRREGCEAVESATWAGNAGARAAHEKLGFREARVVYRLRL